MSLLRELDEITSNRLRRKIDSLSGDGAYDTKECHKVLQRKDITPLIPPHKNAGFWDDGHPRNEAIKALKSDTLAQWKINSCYHGHSISETAMSRYKGLTSGQRLLMSMP